MRKFLVQQCWVINLLTFYSENVWMTDKNIVIAIILFCFKKVNYSTKFSYYYLLNHFLQDMRCFEY